MWGQEGVLSLLEKPKIESPDLLSDVQFNVILYSVHPVASLLLLDSPQHDNMLISSVRLWGVGPGRPGGTCLYFTPTLKVKCCARKVV